MTILKIETDKIDAAIKSKNKFIIKYIIVSLTRNANNNISYQSEGSYSK